MLSFYACLAENPGLKIENPGFYAPNARRMTEWAFARGKRSLRVDALAPTTSARDYTEPLETKILSCAAWSSSTRSGNTNIICGCCPHPRVTAVAKKDRNRRAACPLPGQGEGSWKTEGENQKRIQTRRTASYAYAKLSLDRERDRNWRRRRNQEIHRLVE